jgi:hypothetical protein
MIIQFIFVVNIKRGADSLKSDQKVIFYYYINSLVDTVIPMTFQLYLIISNNNRVTTIFSKNHFLVNEIFNLKLEKSKNQIEIESSNP